MNGWTDWVFERLGDESLFRALRGGQIQPVGVLLRPLSPVGKVSCVQDRSLPTKPIYRRENSTGAIAGRKSAFLKVNYDEEDLPERPCFSTLAGPGAGCFSSTGFGADASPCSIHLHRSAHLAQR